MTVTRRTLYLIIAALDVVSAAGADYRGQWQLALGLLAVAGCALFVARNSPKGTTR